MRGIVGTVVLNTTTMDKVEEGIKYDVMDVVTLALSPICEDKRTTPRQTLLRGGFL